MKKTLFTYLLAACALTSSAQTDLTKYLLSNYGFDQDYDYTAAQSDAVSQEIKDVKGWNANLSANYTIVGTYEFGFKGTFNTASVPSKGYDGEAGGGLAISTGWEQTFAFSQDVTLPAGKYTINVPTYNGSSATAATSLLAWIPASGTTIKSTRASFAANAWTLDQISFTLSATTKGKIQFGMAAAAGGSANTAKLIVDYIKILGTDVAADKSQLSATIASATKSYGSGNGNGAAQLKAAIDNAQAVADNDNADIVAIYEAISALEDSLNTYKLQNVSEENPLDKTEYIVNNSFENDLKGWTVDGLVSQSNSSFTKKAGSKYIEKWVGQGNHVGNASISQTISLPNGVYVLTVAAQNLNQSATTQKCTGAKIYADNAETDVFTPADYTVKFTSLTGKTEIGFVATEATGNWLAVDNFRLSLIGEVDGEAAFNEVQNIIAEAELLQKQMMYASAANALSAAIEKARLITASSAEQDVAEAVSSLHAAIKAAKSATADYKLLTDAISSATAIYDATKNGAEELKAEIDKANLLAKNGNATQADINAEIDAIEKAILAFHIANATPGTGSAPSVTSTNKYVATGATEALVRATMTGSNILERGVCWSTDHNPTVLDNRTTKSFSLNGYIYHIKGLTPSTVYYVRPYIMNNTYTIAYGDEVKVVTHPAGGCTWSWNEGAPDDAANTRCRNAIKETIDYFNEWTGIKGFHLTGNYGSGTPTADCGYGGWMRIGPNAAYQAIGTVLHETGHGVGVGTHWVWNNCTYTRESNGNSGKWLGRAANEVYQFLENKYTAETYFKGDKTHGWGNNATYDWLVNGADKDRHSELQYIGGMCILYGLFLDGLCPTSNHANGIAGYTYNFDDAKKYYIMNKSSERGLGDGLVSQRGTATAVWKPCLTEAAVNDSAAWYMEFDAQNGLYMFRNAVSGKYLTRSNVTTSMSVKQTTTPSASEKFQLMPDRTDVTIGIKDKAITTHGYWFTWNDNGNKAMQANAISTRTGYGTFEQATFNFSDNATRQQWIIISEDELPNYIAAAVATGIKDINYDSNTEEATKVVGIYSADGIAINKPAKGLNIIKYSNGSVKKVYIK